MIFNKLFRTTSSASPCGRGLLILLCALISLTTTNQTTIEEQRPTTEMPRTTVQSSENHPYNQVRIKEVRCSDYNMTVILSFSNSFKGRVYTRHFPHVDGCGFHVPEPYSVNVANLDIKHHTCGSMLNETSLGIFVKNRVKVRFHPTIPTKYDTALKVSCTIPKVVTPIENSNSRDFIRYDKREANLDVVLGSELNPESFQGSNFDPSAFYLKITVARKFHSTDIVVRNCIAHNKKTLNDNDTLCQLNGFYGCNESKILDENFQIMNGLNNVVKVLKFKDPSILNLKPLFITCGINICENRCQRNCDFHVLHRPNIFTHFAHKVIHLNRSAISNIIPQAGQDIYSNCLT